MNKYLTFDDEYDMYDIKKPVLAKFLISQGFDKRDIKQWFDDHDAYDESIINSFDDLEESTEEEIEDWAKTEMEFYSEGNDFDINENKMSKEFLYMQKLAGVITEGEYNAKMNENNESEDFLDQMIDGSIPEDSEEGERVVGVWEASEYADEEEYGEAAEEFKATHQYILDNGGEITIEGNPDVTYTALDNGDIKYDLIVTLN
jgi:hypothetical protein